jgi:D-glycero-alpha-D-manno-heptose-7-phosphate kinase
VILTRSPLRISLGGGGTDLPSFYEKFGGFVISAAIDKYVYVAVNKPFIEKYILKYSDVERCDSIEGIKHPIIRESLRLLLDSKSKVEISTLADIPSGTGLGSSGSFTVGLIKALSAYTNKPIHAEELAELACQVEIEILKEPIGKQDQYIAAYGGISQFDFSQSGQVRTTNLKISKESICDLEDNLLLFYTGTSRSASAILSDQVEKSKNSDTNMLDNLQFTKELGFKSKELLLKGDLSSYGALMHEHWMHKRSRSQGMSNSVIDEAYMDALKNGAVGGKLVGAGGGGFLMFYAHDAERLRLCMSKWKMEEIRFKFDFQGAVLVIS